MKARYTSPDTRLTVDFEAAGVKEIFESLAGLQEVFEEPACGCCKSTRIRCDVRTPQTFKYFQLICGDCGARLDFGQSKDMLRLFAKRTDKHGEPIPNRGWYVYTGPDSDPHDRTQHYPPATAPSTVSGQHGHGQHYAPDPAVASKNVLTLYANRLAGATAMIQVDTVIAELNQGAGRPLIEPDKTTIRRLIQETKARVSSDSADVPF